MPCFNLKHSRVALLGTEPNQAFCTLAPIFVSPLCASSISQSVQAAVALNLSQCLAAHIGSLPHCISNAKRQPSVQQAMLWNLVP
jgi:hypothetical protein